MTTMSPQQSRCGCAFSSVGFPCVAHRVWPMPVVPAGYAPSSPLRGAESFPAVFAISIAPPSTTAIPALSYPRYSSRCSPSSSSGAASRSPVYPMIPHITPPPRPPFRPLARVLVGGSIRRTLTPPARPRQTRSHECATTRRVAGLVQVHACREEKGGIETRSLDARWAGLCRALSRRVFLPPMTTVLAGRPSAESFDKPPPRHPDCLRLRRPGFSARCSGPGATAWLLPLPFVGCVPPPHAWAETAPPSVELKSTHDFPFVVTPGLA